MKMESPEPLHRKIQRARKLTLRLTQEKFVKFAQEQGLKISLSTYQKLESGHLKYISDETLIKISKILNLSQNDLLRSKEREVHAIRNYKSKFEGKYLKIAYSNSSPGAITIDIVNVRYEPDIRDLRVYISDTRYEYIGTVEKREHIVYFTLEELGGGVEKLFWVMRDDVGKHVEALWGLACALTPSGIPYAYKTVLLKATSSNSSSVISEIERANKSERYLNQDDLEKAILKISYNETVANMYFKKIRDYLESVSLTPESLQKPIPNMIYAEKF